MVLKVSELQQIKKRDGRMVPFDRAKIREAILKAAEAVQGQDAARADELADLVVERVTADSAGKAPTVEAIQDAIEKVLIAAGHARTAKAFILYRARRSRIREGRTELMDAVADILEAESGAQAPAKLMAIGAAASREYYLNRLLPEELADAHLAGEMHVHGLAHYAKAPQVFVLPYRHLLTHGFMSGHAHIRPPRRADSAAALTALMLQSAQSDCYGALVLADYDRDLASVLPPDTPDEALFQAAEALVHQLNAQPSQANGTLPRVTIQIGLAESALGMRVARALLLALDAGLGRGETALRPQVVYRLKAGWNLLEGEPGYALTREAAAIATRTLALSFASGEAPAAHAGHEGSVGEAGLGQVARVTLNLPRVALRARREGQPFEQALARAVALAARQLQHRQAVLAARPVAEFPLLFGQQLHQGAEGLKPQDPIGPALAASTLSIGFVGLAEALVVLKGHHHGESAEAQALGLSIIEALAAHCARLSAETGLRFVAAASDAVALGERLARLDRREFGMIRGVTETPRYSHGAQVPDEAALDPAARLAIEGAYAPYLSGGSFSATVLAGAPSPSEVLAWLQAAAASGQQLFSLEFPRVHCQACGKAGDPSEACTTCSSPALMLRAVRRRRGYLDLE